jgi:hypothetical protein
MNSLHLSLITCIERIVRIPPSGFSSAVLSGKELEWPRMGIYFTLQKDDAAHAVCPWFGLYDTAVGPIIFIGFTGVTGWRLSEGSSFKRPYIDFVRQEFCFALKEERLAEFKSARSFIVKEKILSDFFTEVIHCIGPSLFN